MGYYLGGGLDMYLYGFLGDKMRTNPGLYGFRTKEYPNTIGYCVNIRKKGVEGWGTIVGTRGGRGVPTGPT